MQALMTTKMTRTFIKLLIGLLVISCNQIKKNQEKSLNQNSEVKPVPDSHLISRNIIAGLLDKALSSDTFYFDSIEPFLYFKSGYFLDKNKKSAIFIHCTTDSTYSVQLYSANNSRWQLTDSVGGLDAFTVQFFPIFDDYNFDQQNDIYIQVTVSNGYSLSRGHLILINPRTGKLEIHQEARKLANMKPDKKTQSIISEEAIWCKKSGFKEVGVWTHKWEKGVLKTIKKDYPCEPE
jgi:hypothetical protein